MSKNAGLGKWAVIDIETTGADAGSDEIIDVGYLQFEGTKLVRKYQSLSRPSFEVSHFIQKLTGITNKMLKDAPRFDDVIWEVLELDDHHLLAHNSDFEASFLDEHFNLLENKEGHYWEDSLYFLSILFPHMSSLKLERFILGMGLADKEEHRGLQDSIDLLKVIILAVMVVKEDKEKQNFLTILFNKYQLQDYFYYKFFNLYTDELQEICDAIDFDPFAYMDIARDFLVGTQIEVEQSEYTENFDLKFSGENVKEIFRDEEKVTELFGGYRYRPSQEALALRVGQSFKNHVHALVQAPTGTGKTLGYLIPSALFSLSEQKQVLVATGTKTLQAQAMQKDVPGLHKLLGLNPKDLRVKQLVGSSNHMCELLFRQLQQEDTLFQTAGEIKDKFTDMYFESAFFYNSKNKIEKMIVRDDLPFLFKMKIPEFKERQKELAVDFRACSGNQCPFKNECTYVRGLREAKDAHVIIGNHALMFSWPKSFPRPQYVVVDEAHKIENESTRAFSYEVTGADLEGMQKQLSNLQGLGSLFYLLNNKLEEDVEEIVSELRNISVDSAKMLTDHIIALPEKMEMVFKKMPRYTDIYWNELPMISGDESDSLRLSIFHHLESVFYVLKSVYDQVYRYTVMWEPQDMNGEAEVTAWTRFEAFVGTLEDIMNALTYLLKVEKPSVPYSLSMKFHNDQGFSFCASPVNTGRILHDQLLQGSSSVVYTSATLANAKGDSGTRGMEWATGYLHSEPERRFKSGMYLPSVYDYENKTKVFLCDDTPSIYDSNFVGDILDKLSPFIEDIGGRTLLLFSARARFEKAVEYLLERFENSLPLFIQGMGSNVVEEFKNSGNGILVGMESFGEGIDVPGDSLSFVFVDKIPDLSMDQVVRLRREFYESNIGNEFDDYYLAHRCRSLHQKLGRLLRTEKDFGAVVIVDARVKKWKNSTMGKLIKHMEPYQLNRTTLDNALVLSKEFIKHEPVSQEEFQATLV